MPDSAGQNPNTPPKSPSAAREEATLASWREKGIFERSLKKDSPRGEFTFYEGPPTANGRPGIHHLEARAFKDAIPRYKTMRGYHVRRKGGWDTHGLPVELQVEKELGLKSKKEIETYGIAAFNQKCKDSVWTYVHEWENFTDRMGYWIDLKDPYITYKPDYIESLWNIVKTVDQKKLLYKDFRVVPWCPQDQTVLSSHEVAQGYEETKDLSVYVKFRAKGETNKYLLAWTTTPWTLPGNVALAVNPKIEYVKVSDNETNEHYILAKDRLADTFKDKKYEIIGPIMGSEMVGIEYEPLYPFLKDNVSETEKDKLTGAFKVYAADFVTTQDGTGIVHIAPMYGQDDFELATKNDLPKYHLVNGDGTFTKDAGFLAGRFVKEKDEKGKPTLDVDIIDDLKKKNLFFGQEWHKHSYPFCWRCHSPLIYFARDSWYIKMSALRNTLVKENEHIHWEPDYIKEGRFGEWIREVKDWAISRERYWGTPLPVWVCETCKKKRVIGSIEEIKQKPKNTYYVMRHGEAQSNVRGILSSKPDEPNDLTENGKDQVRKGAQSLKDKKIDLIISSDFVRAKETAEIIAENIGIEKSSIVYDERLREFNSGEFDQKKIEEYHAFTGSFTGGFTKTPRDGENYGDVKKRAGAFLYDIETRYQGKNILIVSHETPIWCMFAAASGLDVKRSVEIHGEDNLFVQNGEVRALDFSILPHNTEYELDLHRPYIDEVKLSCDCGGEMKRVKEVMDVWFDSGAMPFAQDHYPFEQKEEGKDGKKEIFDPKGGLFTKKKGYPADFISEAIDQTRGWFYTLHAIGALMGTGRAFNNVICLGHILDAEGKKMSKSIGNVVNPWEMMDKYGADALRFWMYSVNQPGESKNFDEKTVDEVNKKVFNLAANVLAFYKLYAEAKSPQLSAAPFIRGNQSQHVLDRWIISRLNELVENVTKNLDDYVFFEPTRAIRDFIADLSQWYLRRSRDRFKSDDTDKQDALMTTRFVLITLAKIMAPFTPFFAEYLYKEAGGELDSVHLEDWPEGGKVDKNLLDEMIQVRTLISIGLELRSKANIKVRQPLLRATLRERGLVGKEELLRLFKDEVNVKEVVVDFNLQNDVELDTTMTPELKEEGMVRELIRAIQDLRKERGLTVNDRATLVVNADDAGRKFIEKNKGPFASATLLKDIIFKENGKEPVSIGDYQVSLDIIWGRA